MALRRSETPNIADIDLEDALERVKPSAIRDILLEVPRVHWDQIGGQEATKQKLKESIEWPLKHPDKFLSFGIKPPKGVLLYGPPGCSKTLLAKVLATESGLNFMAVKGPELFSKWVGDSEKAIREIFRKARLAAPSIVFFDEFDAIGATRSLESSVSDRVVSQLLSEMDGTDPLVSVTIVAATNRPDIIDPALLRPGRFDRHVYVALPDLAARYEIFMINSRKMPFDSTVDLKILAEATEGYSGAEVVAVCQEAALQALSEDVNIPTISANHFERALALVTPRTPPEMIRFFDDFATRHR
jgi:AAA family ATPase